MEDKDLSQEVISEMMLEKELKKLEGAKVALANVAEEIQANIVKLNADLVLAEATSSVATKVFRDKIAALGKERTALAVTFSAEKARSEQVLEDLEKETEIKRAEKKAIDTSSRKADDILEKKAADIKVETAQLEEFKGQVAQKAEDLTSAEIEFADTQAISRKQIQELTVKLAEQTDMAVAEGGITKSAILKNEELVKDMAARSVELDEKLSKIQAATAVRASLDAIEKGLETRKQVLDAQSIDMKASVGDTRDREASVQIRELAVGVREKKVMLGEKQLREARNA